MIFAKSKLNPGQVLKPYLFMENWANEESIYELTQNMGNYVILTRTFHSNTYKLKGLIDLVYKCSDLIAERVILPATHSNKAWGFKLPQED